MGSGLIWQKALQKYGKEIFEKEILYEGDFFREEEEKILKELNAADDPMSYNMKNEALGGSFPGEKNGMFGKKLTTEEKYKCGSAFRGKNRPDHSERMKGEENPMFGKSKHAETIAAIAKSNTGKTYEEIHGKEKAAEIKNKLSESLSGVCKPYLSEMYQGEGNPFFGKTHSDDAKVRISAQWNDPRRRQKHDITMKKAGEKKKGIKPGQLYVLSKCEHCSIEATQSNITKWHGDNCKMNPNNPQNEIGDFEYISCTQCDFRPNTSKPNSRRNFAVYHLDNCKSIGEGYE
jgi:hypothetical protein